ncbi:hypothetical protein ABB37_00250 [Leptomonas pyrrhocoris]|uniref:Uncharacterized protein n=1 Tax=Leptomonas pyrrhocoris TaxID=157538 RepID=A0A0N0E022_LEPPY|nr:hypothetical protein ABB37_00250 [Leptomonas pyrrhocoris]KPA85952.1 hypothetical protein ABB37_00250 [Leptomonas pyrrhocoris]|eukprot:XP_015664391.1 hypothetical protein ABB37_00250 [Leptomonas pyrrhocoris]
MENLHPSAATTSPLMPSAVEANAPLSAVETEAAVPTAHHESPKGPSSLHCQTDVPSHSTENASDSESACAEQPLRNALSFHTASATASCESQSGSVKSAQLKNKSQGNGGTGTSILPLLDAVALSSSASKRSAVAAASVASSHRDVQEDELGESAAPKEKRAEAAAGGAPADGGSGGGNDSCVATPCFSIGVRSPHYTPSNQALPLRPKPRRLASLGEKQGETQQGNSVDAATASLRQQQNRAIREDHRGAESSEASAAKAEHGRNAGHNDEKQTLRTSAPCVDPSRELDNEEGDQHKAVSPTGRKQPRNHHESGDDVKKEAKEEDAGNDEARNAPPWCPPDSANRGGVTNTCNDCGSSSNLHGATAPPTDNTVQPSLSPYHSYVPWKLSEGNGREDDGGHVSLTFFDAKHASISNEESTRSPAPPKPRTRTDATTKAESNSSSHVATTSGAPNNAEGDARQTSPRDEVVIEGKGTSIDVATIDSGSYAGSGRHGSESAMAMAAAAAAAAAVNAPAAPLGGGGVRRQNPAMLAFSGSSSGSGSQGGEGTIDRSISSRFSVPSRGPASLSPPYLAVDEESGELAVVFRRGGVGQPSAAAAGGAAPSLYSSGSSGSATYNVVRNGVPTSPTHLEFSHPLDETFGTMVSTMSTTFSTTTNSVGDGDSVSPADTYRLQVAAQMRQALLQTLGLNVGSDGGNTTGATTQGQQQSEKAASPMSTSASSAEATTSSGVLLPLSPLQDKNNDAPRLAHLGHAMDGGGSHVIVTPTVLSRNSSTAGVNLASSASLSTNSATSPTAGAQTRTAAAIFAALTTPSPRLRSKKAAFAFHANPTFFDIDSGAEDEEAEGRSDGRLDALRLSLSEEGSRMLSMSVSNPLMYEDLASSEMSTSQQFNTAVQPPPSLQLAYPFRRHSLTENFTEVMPGRGTPVSGTPTFSVSRLNNTTEDVFSNSTSSLMPPMLKFTARGGGDEGAALEAAAAEAVREVNSGNLDVDEDEKEDSSRPAPLLPPPVVCSPVAYACSLRDSDSSNLRASSHSDISPLNIDGVPVANVGKLRSSYEMARRTPFSSSPKSAAAQEAETEHTDGNSNEEEAINDAVTSALGAAPGAATTTTTAVAAADSLHAVSSPESAARDGNVSVALSAAEPEWSSHSLIRSVRSSPHRGEDGVNSTEDDVTGTATTRVPTSSSPSQFQIQPTSSVSFGETPGLLLDAASYSYSRRDFVNSSATISSISGALAAEAQQSHADPATSRPGSATTTATTTTNGDLSASTSTRMWSDGIATTAAAVLFRRHGDDATQEDAESLVMPQRFGAFTSIPMPRLSTAGGEKGGVSLRSGTNSAMQRDIDDGNEANAPSGNPHTVNPLGTLSLTPTPPPPLAQQQMPDAQGANTVDMANLSDEKVKETEESARLNNPDNEGDTWGEPMSSVQSLQKQQYADDEFAEPAVTSVAGGGEKHVRFADRSEMQFVDPLSSPWADRDFFYQPDYTHMEFKNASLPNSAPEDAKGNDGESSSATDEEEANILRAVTPFRFTHRCKDVHGSPTPRSFTGPSVPSWANWPRGAGTRKPQAAPSEISARHDGAPEAAVSPTVRNDDDAEGERAPRIFFTKERLASRAALMEARRAALQGKSSTDVSSSIVGKPNGPAAALGSGVVLRPETSAVGQITPASASARLHINLAPPPPPPPAAAAISVALPDFAAPVTSTASSGRSGMLCGPPPPPLGSAPTAPAPASASRAAEVNSNDNDDDGFGGWVQQGAAPPQQVKDTAAAPFKLTKEWCVQVAADLKKRGNECPPCAESAAIPLDPARVVDVLHAVFGEDNLFTSPSPHGKPASTSASIGSHNHDADEASATMNTSRGAAPRVSGEIRGVDGVLEALSFTSLTQPNGPATATGSFATTFTSTNARATNSSMSSAPAIEGSGYVVPWRTRTSATSTAAAQTTMNNAAAIEAGVAGKTDNGNAAPAEENDPVELSLRLTRHLFFPDQEQGGRCDNDSAAPSAAASCQVSSFMGTRRLPDAATAAQWTERDVLLAVQQEQRRMAQESEGAMETERLEDVLRLSS